jgi:hypothetical protein
VLRDPLGVAGTAVLAFADSFYDSCNKILLIHVNFAATLANLSGRDITDVRN